MSAEDLPMTAAGRRAWVGEPAYLRTLFLLLISATFFEGYDGTIVSLLLEDIQRSFSASEAVLGVSRSLIELGLFFAFFLTRLADRRGRRALLVWSVAGYTVATVATAFAWDLWSFTLLQMLARVFLGAEYAVAVTMIVEEFPAEQRARAIGKLLMFGALGDLTVALLLVAGAHEGPLEWRALFLVGVIPLVALAWLRRRLRETRRFAEHQRTLDAEQAAGPGGIWEPWSAVYRWRLLLVGLIHLLRSLPFFAATAWFFFYAEREQGVGENALYLIFLVAFAFGLVGYGMCGSLLERLGRRPTTLLYLGGSFVSGLALFQVRGTLAIALVLPVAIFFGIGAAPALAAMATELFPTPIRSQAAAWARNVFEIGGFVLGPLLVGVLGDHYRGAVGSIGDTISLLFFLFVPAIWLVYRYLPEVRGEELEAIAARLAVGAPTARQMRRRRWASVELAGLTAIAALVVLVIGPGSGPRRAEGAVERFLHAISTANEEQIDRWGEPGLAARMADFDPDDDTRFATIEVGRGLATGRQATVPARVVRNDAADTVVHLKLTAQRQPGRSSDWQVIGSEPVGRAAVPSEGAPRPARAPVGAWFGTGVVAAALAIASDLALRRLRHRNLEVTQWMSSTPPA